MLRRFSRLGGLLFCCALLSPVAGHASPLGLTAGDVVDLIEIDALRANGDGVAYTAGTTTAVADGQATSVVRSVGGGPLLQTGVDFAFDVSLVSQSVTPIAGNLVLIDVTFGNASPTAFSMTEVGLGTVLTASFATPFSLSGFVNILSPTLSLTGSANLAITGGNSLLVSALGGAAELDLDAAAFNFLPPLATIAADGNIFNDDSTFALSGVLRPTAPSPFVPEPSTALLMASGLLGLLGAGRRVRVQ